MRRGTGVSSRVRVPLGYGPRSEGRQRSPSPKSKPFERMYRPTPCEGVRDVKPIRSYRIVCMRACVMKVKEVIRR